MSISTTPLSEPCKKELLRIIGFVTDKELATLLKIEPLFSAGGFRSQKPALLRKRLEQIVIGGTPVSTQVRSMLAAHSRAASLLSHISTETLTRKSAEWAALLGEPVFLIAALIDSRKTVRARAEHWLERSPHFLSTDPPLARADLAATFADVLELAGALPGGDVPVTRESWNEQKERLEQRIRTLQTENRRLKGVDDQCSRTASLLRKAAEENESFALKLKSSETQLRQARQEVESVKAELQRETSRREERLQAALEAALAREFHGWLAEARAVESAALHPEAARDAIEFARAALRKQAQTDRHSHNRAELTARLEQLRELNGTVRASLRNALRQCPELKQAGEKIEQEISALERLLPPGESAAPLEEALISKIHAAADEALPQLRALPKLLRELKLLTPHSFENVESEFNRRLSAIEALGVPPEPELDRREDGLSLLGSALAGRTPAILILDGHNIIFGLPARYMPARGKSVTDAQKRQNLIDDLVRITRPNPAVRAILLFDGHTRSDTNPSANVIVTYSGGEGEHRADRVIIDKIRFLKSAYPDTTVLLVSNDNELCKDGRRLGARNVSVLEFGSFL